MGEQTEKVKRRGRELTKMKPIDYAKAACDTMMRKFEAKDLPPKGHFHYHQGVFLSGMYQTWQLCQEDNYMNYIKDWVDSVVEQNGEIPSSNPGQLDDIQPGILLYPLYEQTKSAHYKKALDDLVEVVKNFPRNSVGGFWHKEWYPHQMWLDGLYMGGPICAKYITLCQTDGERQELVELVAEQILLMRKYTIDERTGLWYHAWDCEKQEEWADKVTGLSPEFWGRSIGWVPVAILDDLDDMPDGIKVGQCSENIRQLVKENPWNCEAWNIEETDIKEVLRQAVKELLEAVCKYQSEEGRWYQVVDKGGQEGNWLETSCTCLYVAAISKAVRAGSLDISYLDYAQKGYEAVIRAMEWDGDDLLIGGVCVGTGVGGYKHYCNRPTSVNDLHGVGAFLIMCVEMEMN